MVKIVAKDYLGVKTLERASPESIAVMVGSEDVRGLDFVVFEQPDITILSGHVEGNDIEDLQPHLSVEIRLASDPSKVESVFPLPLVLLARDLPRSKHLVQLRSRFPSSSHRFQSEILEVDLEKQPQTHAGPLRYNVKEENHKQEPTPAPVFPLIVGVSVIALFISIPRLKDLYQLAAGWFLWDQAQYPLKRNHGSKF
ncbi:nodal modulator [Musa troglodytarum]|uniref:Nodal modulator n=1 Tax=Musa troglodytarum TaxID=320322 RepID=A0A9E7JJZ5_9LILI|nr:nodal modulator [Musa troglodytarum]URD83822.1 nodal modulator [Musa troglodytarum]